MPIQKVHNDHQITTPLLKLLLQFYGNLSVQLYTVSTANWHSILNFIWNLLLLHILSLMLTTKENRTVYDEQFHTAQFTDIFRKKPLFSLLLSVILKHIFTICFALNQLYFALLAFRHHSPSLISQLDYFHRFTLYRHHPRRLFFCLIVVHITIYLFAIDWLISVLATVHQSRLKIGILYVVLFALNVNAALTFILTVYYRLATERLLHQMIISFKTTQNVVQLEADFTSLALANRDLNGLFSLPLLLGILPYVVQLLANSASLLLPNVAFANANLLQFSIPLVYLCYNQWQIEQHLQHLAALLGPASDNRRLFTSTFHLTPTSPNAGQQCLRSRELLALHRQYFRLKIFNMFTLNGAFLVSLLVFVLNYVVLVTQTSSS